MSQAGGSRSRPSRSSSEGVCRARCLLGMGMPVQERAVLQPGCVMWARQSHCHLIEYIWKKYCPSEHPTLGWHGWGLCAPLTLFSHPIQAAPEAVRKEVPAAAADSKGAGGCLLTSLPMPRATSPSLKGAPGGASLGPPLVGRGVDSQCCDTHCPSAMTVDSTKASVQCPGIGCRKSSHLPAPSG